MRDSSALATVAVLTPYQQRIEQKLATSIVTLGPSSELRDACAYALLGGGKRFRPVLTLLIAEALGHGADVMEAALSIEFLHTASLVADDLPCMDDDDERRNRPSLHKVYGETVALLVSYALIAAGYECLAKNARILEAAKRPFSAQSSQRCLLALENLTLNTGLHGATGGQFLDVFPPDLSLPTLREVIHKKTISLFECAFVNGWLFGGGEIALLPLVKRAAAHFGMAFQIADDLGDVEQDAHNGRKVNMAAVFGKEAAQQLFDAEIAQFFETLQQLKIDSSVLRQVGQLLQG